MRLDATAVRRMALGAQGLVTPPPGSLAQVVAATGYLRTLGGIEAYLALKARRPIITRATIDLAIGAGELRVMPSVRGCMYLVPESHVDRCLALAESLAHDRDARDAERAGIREAELDQLAAHVLAALREGPATTDALRKRMPEGTVRKLGPEAKKLGVSSPLPLALRRLEFAGAIARAPERDRVDTERYQWRKRKGGMTPPANAQLYQGLARAYFAWAAVATVRAFAAWSGLGVRTAEAACAAIPLTEVVLDDGRPALADPEALRAAERAVDVVALLPFEDNLVALTGAPGQWIAPEHHDIAVPAIGTFAAGTSDAQGDAKRMHMRAIVAGDRIVGLWEYDPDRGTIVTRSFGRIDGDHADRIDAAAAALSAFIRDEVGHGRSFALDTDAALRERVAFLRAI
ncbi:MAG: winged helix DNA-binding domain-containing protein [Deltaproteobacteria bacterium]|nr:winged helix DNA-binding domain-containing protein [Deltaproteobacteria bacterium]MBK8239511.1 winged helix DNA-binding domain-containing protein [Deltaproteobacteria bacterium]MBK8719310.1 winged helix DNA-binding domain-containing protein [Deltaproteobacteria bacterium]MBP7290006.1 winged helix DNA-binding domain-containing protein [Nannocystaceae bacterium]